MGWDIDDNNYVKEQPWPGDTNWGTAIKSNMGIEFSQAYQKIDPTINLPDPGDALYAPTLIGPDQCRLESVSSYYHNGATTLRRWQVYTHSTTTPGQGVFITIYDMDANFCTRYGGGNNEVITRVAKTGAYPHWSVYLYDRIDSEWDFVCGAYGARPDASGGWDAWEQWYLGTGSNWPSLPQITSRYLLVQVNGTPYFVTSTYGYQLDTGIAIPYSKSMVSNYYQWSVGP